MGKSDSDGGIGSSSDSDSDSDGDGATGAGRSSSDSDSNYYGLERKVKADHEWADEPAASTDLLLTRATHPPMPSGVPDLSTDEPV